MKYEVPFRVIVTNPLDGVLMRVQKGSGELLGPSHHSGESISFEFDVTIDVDRDELNFLGKFAQGPKNSRFIYVNSGEYAGQADTCWARRAKLSLMSITVSQVREATANSASCFETVIPGVGRDGGPVCASIQGIEWKVVTR